ncbi:hypothetical protein AtNW77_Chr3g0169791 [Arabidopsis thaliana]
MYIKDDVEGCFIEKRGSNGLVNRIFAEDLEPLDFNVLLMVSF